MIPTELGICEDCKRYKVLFVVNGKKQCYVCIAIALERKQHACEWLEPKDEEKEGS